MSKLKVWSQKQIEELGQRYWTCKVEYDLILTASQMTDILTGCFEGGSNYWIEGHVRMLEMEKGVEIPYGDLFASDWVAIGGKVAIPVRDDSQNIIVKHNHIKNDVEDPDIVFYVLVDCILDAEALFEGYKLFHNKNQDLAFEDMDASDYDAILQYALFGEVVYG